jgi:hypothetical protein
MLLDSSIVGDVERRWRSYGGDKLKPRDLSGKTPARAAAADVPDRFWHARGLAPTPDGRTFRAVATAAAGIVDGLSLPPDRRAERILGSSDLLEIVFLQAALAVARTVARVRVNGPTGALLGFGTGFMVSPRLLMTNWHVLKTPEQAVVSNVEFGFETRLGDGAAHPGSVFRLDPARFYFSDPTLDFALVAVASSAVDGTALSTFGFNRLVDNDVDLIIEGQFSNIIQHPSGQPKQLAFRQNEVIAKPGDFLHYRTDTAPGSSGAPVFNDQWQVVALHRAGVWATNSAGQILATDGSVWREEMGEDRIRWVANEGARVPRLMVRWRNPGRGLPGDFLEELFAPGVPAVTERLEPPASAQPDQPPSPQPGLHADEASVVISSDGVATWTVPLRVSVGLGALARPVPPPQPQVPRPEMPAPEPSAAPDLDTVLRKAQQVISAGRNDILKIRPGWVYDENGITDRRALVVTVRQLRTRAELVAAGVTELPETFMGYPVEVMGPTVEDLLRLGIGPARTEALLTAVTAEEITYRPPADLDLRSVTDSMRVIAHVSPDAGWPTLEPFIAGAKRRLTAAMYEFTAEHVREALTGVARKSGFQKLTLVLDSRRGSTNNPANVRDSEAMVRDMRQVLDDKLEVSWVKLGAVNGWVNHDYHIKVMVRDGKALWLSSGNWKPSGQPKADPKDNNALLHKLLREENREWHAIIEHEGLAKTFELAIRGDFEANRGTRPEELFEELPELAVFSAMPPAAEEALGVVTFHAPFDDKRTFTVHPILTPDNYLDVVVPAVKNATKSVLVQNQTLATPPNSADQRFQAFWEAVLDQQKRGRDVRLIFRLQDRDAGQARVDMDALKDFGFDKKRIKIQKGCHTKGIVIDGQRVLLGSHNLSNTGATTNRDASLLFDDAPLAKYFGDLFEHDWNNVAETLKPKHWKTSAVRRVESGATAPEGFVPFDWKEWFETR